MSSGRENSKIKNFMGKTPNAIKLKFLSVLGNSSDIISGISNKIDAALSLTSSSETETTANRNEEKVRNKLKEQHEKANCFEYSLDDHIIDYESRRVKERRAHEEILSGRYRHPAFIARLSTTDGTHKNQSFKSSFSADLCSVPNKVVIANSPVNIPCSNHHIPNQTSPSVDIVVDSSTTFDTSSSTKNIIPKSTKANQTTKDNNNLLGLPSSNLSASTCETSENDNISGGEGSLESLDVKMWHRSCSDPPSSISSISLDSQTEEAVLEFMRRFTSILFSDCASITLELKSEFGQYSRTETGRLWFAKLLNAQRAKTKRVDETTFYALIQYFAIILFECAEAEDFSPAKTLMTLSFTFYHEIDVPGCEPYREYLYTYLRDQPIWHTLRFWNAAFFDSLQNERSHKPVPPTNVPQSLSTSSNLFMNLDEEKMSGAFKSNLEKNSSLPISDNDMTSSSSSSSPSVSSSEEISHRSLALSLNKGKKIQMKKGSSNNMSEIIEDKKFQQNITFGQLGSFTCNMHAFGLTRDLCNEFLRKQCTIANLSKDQERMLQENVNRLYRETDPWRTS